MYVTSVSTNNNIRISTVCSLLVESDSVVTIFLLFFSFVWVGFTMVLGKFHLRLAVCFCVFHHGVPALMSGFLEKTHEDIQVGNSTTTPALSKVEVPGGSANMENSTCLV